MEFARRAAFARIVGVEDRQIAEVAVVQESVRFAAVFTCPCGPGRSLVRIVALWSGAAQSSSPAQLSYANVIATLALFIALGGSPCAALKLPRNSVGAAQIRAGAVRSSEVRDGSLQASDLSAGARQTLGGGGSGRVFFAHVGGGGEADCGNATFAAPAGRITVHQDGDHVGVQTYDAGGDPANLPFDVIMAC